MKASELVVALQRVIAERGDMDVFGTWEGQVQSVDLRFTTIEQQPYGGIYFDVDTMRWIEDGNLAGVPAGGMG